MKMKPKPKNSKKPTLSEKIADSLTLKPRADIEDDQVFGTKPQTVSRADFGSSESEDEALISDFRKRNVNLLSAVNKKYEGNVITRRELQQSDESDSSLDENSLPSQKQNGKQQLPFDSQTELQDEKSEEKSESDSASDIESDDYSITKSQKKSKCDSDDENSEDEQQSSDDDEQGSDEGEGYDISQLEEPLNENFEHVKKQNISEEAKKGNSVRNQLLLWEGLLEMRIHLQRCMNTANQLPLPNTYEELKEENDFLEESNATKANVTNVLDKLITLQNLLLKNYPETKTLSTKKQDKMEATTKVKPDSDEEIPSDTDNEEIPSDTEEDEPVEKEKEKVSTHNKTINATAKKRKLEDYEKEIAISHKAFKMFRDAAIQKWNEKTRLATATNIKTAPTNTILQQISYILSDRGKLVKRTQLKRSEYDIVGYRKEIDNQNSEENSGIKDRKDNDEYISEIFDDSDFYHQLLRELIECKSADISDPVQLSRQWIALQQMRSKMKRKVDTKATKGRKIKYVVHNKLVNYMAPEKCISWTEESTNELYSSLFGKIFEHNNVGVNADVGNVFKIKK